MPREIITIQLGQCGNQSESMQEDIHVHVALCCACVCVVTCSWNGVLETTVYRAWNQSRFASCSSHPLSDVNGPIYRGCFRRF